MSRQRKTSQFTTLVRVLAFLCLLGFASSAQAANSFVQAGIGSSGLATTVATGEGTGGDALETTVTGNAVICAVRWQTQARTLDSVGDGTNTYTLSTTISHGGMAVSMALAYDLDITGTATEVTATFSGGSFDVAIICHEVDVDSGIALDTGVVSDNAEAGTAVDCPAITPSNNGAYVFGSATVISSNQTFAPNTATNNWTEAGEVAGSDADLQAQYFVQTTAAAISAEWTQSSTGDSMCMAMSVSAAGGGGGGSGVISSRMLLGVGK